MRGGCARIKLPRGRTDARRSSCEMRPFRSPGVPCVHPPRHRCAPFFHFEIRQRFAEQSGESSVHRHRGVPRTPFPGGCAFAARTSVDCNEVSRFRGKLAPANFPTTTSSRPVFAFTRSPEAAIHYRRRGRGLFQSEIGFWDRSRCGDANARNYFPRSYQEVVNLLHWTSGGSRDIVLIGPLYPSD